MGRGKNNLAAVSDTADLPASRYSLRYHMRDDQPIPVVHAIEREEIQNTSLNTDQTEVSYGGAFYESWRMFKDGPLHREDGPALIEIHPDGRIIEQYAQYGESYREDGLPAYLETHLSGLRIERVGDEESDSVAITEAPEGEHQERMTLPNGVIIEGHYVGGALHRDGLPAFIVTDEDGRIIVEKWYQNGGLYRELEHRVDGATAERYYDNEGQMHRDDGPALSKYFPDGSSLEVYYQHGKKSRQDGPAYTESQIDGARSEQYYEDGKLHRNGGPATAESAADGSKSETYYQYGKRIRQDGPTQIEIRADGTTIERYHNGHCLHRDEGPALIKKFLDGSKVEVYYQNGKKLRTVEIQSDGTLIEK